MNKIEKFKIKRLRVSKNPRVVLWSKVLDKAHKDEFTDEIPRPPRSKNPRRLSKTKAYRGVKKAAKTTHRVIAVQPHDKLMNRYSIYNRWHSWQYKRINHNHVHIAATVSSIFAVIVIVSNSMGTVHALSAWTQTDWSGGMGTNATNQYTEKSNVDTSGGALKLADIDAVTNGGFESSLNGWKMSGTSSGTFATKVDYTAGANSYGVATGDFNKDGNVDLATANYNGNSVSILLGNGNGTFAAKVDYAAGSTPYAVSVGDFNGDNNQDLVVANFDGNTVSVLLGSSNGTFGSPTGYSIGARVYDVKIGDFNGDSKLDLAATNSPGNSVSILLGNGNGTFAAKVDYTVGSYPKEVILGDFNGDSKLDIATANSGTTTVSILLGNGSGAFATKVDYTVGSVPSGIAVGDINADSKLDLVVANNGSDTVSTLLGSGNGTFASKVDYATGSHPVQVILQDLNSDGNLDVAVTDNTVAKASILLGNGNGTFAAKVDYVTGSAPYDLAAADFNRDGNPDLAVANSSSSTASVLLNRGDSYAQSTSYAYNGSGHSVKIVAVNSSNNTLFQVLTAPGTYTSDLTAYIYTNGSAVSVNDAQLSAGGTLLSTTYTTTSTAGWYKLTASLNSQSVGYGSPTSYGVNVKAGKTVYIDNVSLTGTPSVGTLTSAIKDVGFGASWGTVTGANDYNVTIKVRTSNNADMSGASSFDDCESIQQDYGDLTSPDYANCVHADDRYVQYQVTLMNTYWYGSSPVEEINISYAPYDVTPPEDNASNITMLRSLPGSSVSDGGWTNGATPFFEWAEGNDSGIGIGGYCVYLGPDSTADPITTKGILGTSPINTGSACPFVTDSTNLYTAGNGILTSALTSSNSPYYLRIKAIDKANNIYTGASAQFSFKFDNTPPQNPSYITAPSQFVSNKAVTLTWPTTGSDAASDSNSGVAGLQYKIGSSSWFGDAHSGNQDANDLLANDGSYTTTSNPDFANIHEGNNIVSFRSWDQAGNVSTAYVTTSIRLNTTSPGTPRNLTASPESNDTNEFGFSWLAPSSFLGGVNYLTYCYSINTLPTANTCSFTPAGVTSLPTGAYATQPGENTIYVVAKDEAGNINYATAASTTFNANTSAPGMPLNIEIADVSTKSSSNWKLALSWDVPTNTGAGIATYQIYRSTDNNSFSQVASTAGTSYVDGSLSQTKYYYKVRACDSVNNCGAYSSTTNKTPTGRFTSPATVTADPKVSGVSTKKAAVNWSTNRASDSKISIGTKTGQYDPFQIASQDQVTDHKVSLNNLSPGTTYFAKASWTDEDGNTGSSSEFSFKTDPAPSTQEVSVNNIGLSSAQIHFTSTAAAKVIIQYGTTDSFGGTKELATSLAKSTYDVDLVGLNDGTKYQFRLNTQDSDGNNYIGSTVLNFTTPARPRISNLRFQPLSGEPTSTQQISWTTNVPATSLVRYADKDGSQQEISDSKLTTDHVMTIRNLIDDREYSLTAESRDSGGNLAVSDTQTLHTALDTRPPKISKFKAEASIRGNGSEARGQIVVSWKTDEPATSQVAYDQGTGLKVLNKKTSEDNTLSTEHIVIISDLSTSRTYSVQPLSRDRSQNQSSGPMRSAIIERPSDSVISIVLNTLKGIFGF